MEFLHLFLRHRFAGKSTGGIAVFSDLFEILGHNILVCRQIMPYQTAGGKIIEEWAEVPSTIS